jgi:integrase/recombinase XerD
MSDLIRHANEYLALRRALGFKLEFHAHVLPQFISYLEAAGAPSITTEHAVAWAGRPTGVSAIYRSHRLGVVRGFARYMRAIDPATELPPPGIWRSPLRRPTPYLYSDEEVALLLKGARQLQPTLRAATYEAIIGLLAATGMRVGEALALFRDDVDLDQGILTVRSGKGNRSRLVPLHSSSTTALSRYAECRDFLCPLPRARTFFVSTVGTAVDYGSLRTTFRQLVNASMPSTKAHLRIHDLRHTFAVRTLVDLYRTGADIQAQIAVLSNYLGHSNPAGTYWYLTASPALMELAAAQLERHWGEPS